MELLSEALSCFPTAGHNRVSTPYGTDVPLCCAIARHIRSRRLAVLAHGRWLSPRTGTGRLFLVASGGLTAARRTGRLLAT
jgi:hypothetical protein